MFKWYTFRLIYGQEARYVCLSGTLLGGGTVKKQVE